MSIDALLAARLIRGALFALSTAAACSSGGGTFVTGDGGADGGSAGDAQLTDPPEPGDASKVDAGKKETSTTSGDTNPYGVPYPTKNIGGTARAGSTEGNITPNLKFKGYRFDGTLDTSALQDIALADYFDPQFQTGVKVLHLAGLAAWSSPDMALAQEMVASTATLAADGGVFLAVLGHGGTVGKPATQADLTAFAAKYKPKFSIAIDPDFVELGALFDASAVPLNVNIDGRSMEILSLELGAPVDLIADVQKWLTWVGSNPAQVP